MKFETQWMVLSLIVNGCKMEITEGSNLDV
jgi:hypothetical protein